MDIVDGIELAQCFANFAQPLFRDDLADQRTLDLACPHRRRPHAAERQRRARHLAVIVLFDERRRRDDGEIAVTARELDEGIAVPGRPAWKRGAGHQLIERDGRRHISDGERGEIDAARAALADHRDCRIKRGGDRDQLRRRIEMAQRAAERAAIARLPMADLPHRLVHQRTALAHQIGKLDVALPRHGADVERAVAVADMAQALDPVEIDDMIRQHKAHVEHRHQRLAAGEQLGVVEAGQQADDIGGAARIVVGKEWRLHPGRVLFLWVFAL